MTSDQELVALLDHVWGSIDDVGRGLTEAEWKTPTEVPGWTVQDNLSHVTALEWRLLGRPDPSHTISGDLAHVRNDFGRANELFVDSRRARAGEDVLAEFEEVTAARLASLRDPAADFGAPSWTPMGDGTVRDLLPFRIFDAWVHEQDMRRAVDHPGDLDGDVAGTAMGRIVGTLPFVVGKKVAPPDGTTVVVDLRAPLAGRYAVAVEGRARPLDDPPSDPTVTVRTDGETFARLACGRLDPKAVLAAGDVAFDGDAALGSRIVESLNFLF
ncbi:MAG TPA: maleylpyruvate isomerase family mycothiol-dependent enzyme [Acidimicrobiia bacterium]|nr:maleylpyruvate isomerase family mycothiol-dependent enzyme [Acidimicrobiia bacterium]